MRVLRVEGAWGIQADYWSPKLNATARAVPGMHNAGGNLWTGELDAVELLAKRLGEIPLRVDVSALQNAHAIGELFVPVASRGLRDYQREAVAFLLTKRRAILADDMGLGKSCSAITAARALNARTLVVCPSYVRGVWASPKGELYKWWPSALKDTFCPSGVTAKPIPPETRVVVIHYDILHAWAAALSAWAPRVVIADEGHAMMNIDSRRTQAVVSASRAAEMIWVLTGTPLTNRPRDLWGVCEVIRPNALGTFFDYGLRYCNAHKEAVTPTKTIWKFDGASNLEELRERLASFMLRRTKADVKLQLPPKTRQIVSVEVPAKARLMPGGGAKEMRVSLDRAADAKVADVLALAREHVSQGHKIVCFCYRRSVAEYLANEIREGGGASEIVHGGTSTLQRGARIEKAKTHAGGHALCVTIDSTATGIDLSYAEIAVVAELLYEPHKLLQMESRLHRFGATLPVLIQYVIATGTTDELITSKVIGKLDLYEKVIGGTGENLAGDLKGTEVDILAELYGMIEKDKTRAKETKRHAKTHR